MDFHCDSEEDDSVGSFYDEGCGDLCSTPKKAADVLTQWEVLRLQQEAVERVSALLSISTSAASLLLRHHAWNESKLEDAWFDDEEGVRKAVGLLPELPHDDDRPLEKGIINVDITCGICFDSFPMNKDIKSASCGHPYCIECWVNYIKMAIGDGIGCLTLRCPEPSCTAAIDDGMIELLASEEDKTRYVNYLCSSYIENSKVYKWCPRPDCEYAVGFRRVGDMTDEKNYGVSCLCSFRFCWNCVEDVHRPVDCGTVAKWLAKNKSESQSIEWILAYTKPCPKCRKPIEKNRGCMHMSCRCGHQFCWLCLGDWDTHTYRGCNVFETWEEDRRDGLTNEENKEMDRARAKASIQKYTHYYERWAANEKSRRQALEDLGNLQAKEMKIICDSQPQTTYDVKFITEAWQQIAECRGVLKWTYAYGYYMPEEKGKTGLFEYLQGQAETALERLHDVAEREVKEFVKVDRKQSDNIDIIGFHAFKSKLITLTNTTKHYFENLVEALENGLSDVDGRRSSEMSQQKKEIDEVRGSTSSGRHGSHGRSTVTTTTAMIMDNTGPYFWGCSSCTLKNPEAILQCQACTAPRPWS